MITMGVQRAHMGSTEYFIGKMRAGEIIANVGSAAELPEWEKMTADEKMQRQPDINRVVNDIVPYIVEDKDRFFGSLIIYIFSEDEDITFEPLGEVVKDLPFAYKEVMKDVGFINLTGRERLIALDGQHRLLSLKIAIRGFNGIPAGQKITPAMKELKPHPELANEEISVILIRHTDTQKIRKIFNKVNKYARQTSRGDNIITSDDDIFAVISRKLFSPGEPLSPIGKNDLVNWKSNTLSQRSKNLTTISALYTISEIILKGEGYSNKKYPDQKGEEKGYAEIAEFWTVLLSRLDIYKEYIKLTKEDKPVSKLRADNLLMKPVTQMALAHVAAYAKKKNVEWKEVADRLNKIDWSFDNQLWYNILVIGSAKKKMITGKESIRAAGNVITYMVMGNVMSRTDVAEVRDIIKNATNSEEAALPEQVI